MASTGLTIRERRCWNGRFMKIYFVVLIICALCGLAVLWTTTLEWATMTTPDPKEHTQYLMSQLAPDDEFRLIDIDNFRFTMNNFPCNRTGNSFLLLILVHSAPGNFEKRRIIRETWRQAVSAERYSFRILFMLGLTESWDSQIALEEENMNNRDLIQGSFQDTYRNLTYKHVMALKWTTYFCRNARFVLKTDDDAFVNTPLLLDYLFRGEPRWGSCDLIMCGLLKKKEVQRSNSKWKVTLQEYKDVTYPTYCLGWVVLYSPDVVFQLYQEVQKHKYFWVDDVHITGTMARIRNITHTEMGFSRLTKTRRQMFVEGKLNMSSFGPTVFGGMWAKRLSNATLDSYIPEYVYDLGGLQGSTSRP